MYSRRRSMRAGRKKGAHYSAPMHQLRITVALSFLLLLAPVAPGRAVPPAQPETDARKAEAELQAVKTEIERVTHQVAEEQVERDKMSRELRGAEVSVAK